MGGQYLSGMYLLPSLLPRSSTAFLSEAVEQGAAELFFLRKNRGLLKREGGLGYDNPAKHTPHKKIRETRM